ncbi:MAG: hypothetical protein GY771_02040 [bacterium]|nr:hypothetical protein [bacterium]
MYSNSGITPEQLRLAVSRGARFVVYEYCVSLVVISFSRYSKPIFVPYGVSGAAAGWKYTALTLLFGWWGFPFGIILSIKALWTNLRGGKDVTESLMGELLYRYESR